jgi:hypothetical protein
MSTSSNSGNSTSLYGEASTPIPDSSGNVIVRGDLYVLSGNILTTATTGNIFPANATTINLGLAATAVNIGAATGTTTINNALTANGTVTAPGADFGNITIAVADDNTITTTSGNLILTSATGNLELAQSADIVYSENNNRLNRPTVKSTTGNTSGLRVAAPNTGSSAQGLFSVVNSSDNLNSEFLQMGSRGSALTNTFRFLTGQYVAGVQSATNKSIAFSDYLNTYATVNPAGPTIGTDLTTIDSLYGGTLDPVFNIATANFVYTDELRAKTDVITVASSPTNIAILQIGENISYPNGYATISVNSNNWQFIDDGRTAFPNYTLPAADGTANQVLTTDGAGSVSWALPGGGGSTFGDITIAVDTDNTISTTSGNLILTSATGDLELAQATIIKYDDSNNRANRPSVQSTTGNSSGFRVLAPNSTTSATSNLTVFGSDDIDNGEFLNIRVSGSTTAPFSIRTGLYTAGVLGASGEEINFIDATTTYASVNPAGPTNSTDLTTKAYVDALTVGVSSVTGGTHVSASPTTGAVVVTTDATDANTVSTIVARDASGNFSAGAGTFTSVITPAIQGGGVPLVITGGATAPSDLTLDDYQTTLTLDGGVGYGDSTLTTAFNTLTWDHTAGGSDPGSVNGIWNLNSDGTTDFPNYTFPYADGTASQVLQTDGTGNLSWYSPADLNTTYDFNATSSTGGANLNLVGSDATTDTVKLTDGGHITAAYTSGTAITLGSDATDANTASTIVARDASGNFAASGATLGNVTVGVDTDQTISTTSGNLVLQTAGGVNTGTITIFSGATGNITLEPSTTGDIHLNSEAIRIGDANATATLATRGTGDLVLTTNEGSGVEGTITIANGANGNITLAPNGTGKVILSDDSYVLGQIVASRNSAYVPPAQNLTTIAGANGIVIASSSGGAGYGASVAVRYHSGDTTAGTANSASVNQSGASGTSITPGGNAANQVMGTFNFDGYTAGTSNNYASAIATANQGAGTTAIQPLQLQGYARQAFTNSVVLTTAVTGASGTGSVATLTFTTQNTAPYAVGQTVAIAGMTPAGYNNAAAVITAATTSSISYANTTTGFTSGGTIAAVNTVTAAGMGFRVRGFAGTTNMTAGNRFNFMDLTASAATFKSGTYTFANEVITGSTLTASNFMTLGFSSGTVGSINQDIFTLKNTAATSTYATLNSTAVTLNGDTVSLRNSAGTTTYGAFTSTGTTITGAGLSTITRTTVGTPTVAESRPSFNIQLSRSDQAAPNDNDGTGFRYRLNGSNATNYTVADMTAIYRTGGDNAWTLQLANGDQTTSTFSGLTTISSKITQTTIAAGTASGTPGASSVAVKLTVDDTKVTAAVPFVFPSYTIVAAGAITGAAGWQISISDSTGNGGRMAYWDTTNARWNYVSDDTAI